MFFRVVVCYILCVVVSGFLFSINFWILWFVRFVFDVIVWCFI